MLERVSLAPNRLEQRSQLLAPSGFFIVPSSFQGLSPTTQQESFSLKKVWFPLAPPKVQSFLWKIIWGRVPTSDRAQEIYPHSSLSPDIWILCSSDSNTIGHFLHCPVG